MKLISPAFKSGQVIPVRYTCEGENVSPPLQWSGVPPEAKSLVLMVDDPDAPSGTFVHWIVINIPAQATGIPEGGPLPAGSAELTNSGRRTGYTPPCPPSGTHRYFFKLFALDVPRLDDVTAAGLMDAMEAHQLAEAELMGRYQRK